MRPFLWCQESTLLSAPWLSFPLWVGWALSPLSFPALSGASAVFRNAILGFFSLLSAIKCPSWAVGSFFQPQGRTVFFSVKLLGLYKGRYTSVQSVQSLSPVWFCDPMNRSRKVHVVLVYSCSINCLHLVAFWTRMLLAFPAISVLWPIPLILPILLVRITAQLLGVWKAVGSVKVGTLPLCCA